MIDRQRLEPDLPKASRMALHLLKIMTPSAPEYRRLGSVIEAAARRAADIVGADAAAAMLIDVAQDIRPTRDLSRRPEAADQVPRHQQSKGQY